MGISRTNLELAGAASDAAEPAARPKPKHQPKQQPTAPSDEPQQRTLKRDSALLREFDGSGDPDLFALYYHYRDRAMDCFNAAEYSTQMVAYYAAGCTLKVVVPRRIQDNDYFLVCLQDKKEENNTPCEVAFNCMRQFCGITMLVKKRCFACNKPGSSMCSGCNCACFCGEKIPITTMILVYFDFVLITIDLDHFQVTSARRLAATPTRSCAGW